MTFFLASEKKISQPRGAAFFNHSYFTNVGTAAPAQKKRARNVTASCASWLTSNICEKNASYRLYRDGLLSLGRKRDFLNSLGKARRLA